MTERKEGYSTGSQDVSAKGRGKVALGFVAAPPRSLGLVVEAQPFAPDPTPSPPWPYTCRIECTVHPLPGTCHRSRTARARLGTAQGPRQGRGMITQRRPVNTPRSARRAFSRVVASPSPKGADPDTCSDCWRHCNSPGTNKRSASIRMGRTEMQQTSPLFRPACLPPSAEPGPVLRCLPRLFSHAG